MILGNIFNTNPSPSGIPNGSNGNIIQRFAEFKKSMEGKDAEAIVKEMLQSGRMTQEQFNRFKTQADGLMKILH